MSLAAPSSATVRSLAARGIQFVKDEGFINREALHRQRIEREEQERAERERQAALASRRKDDAITAWLATADPAITKAMTPATRILRRFIGVYGASLSDIKGPSRKRDIVLVRMAAMYWIRRRTKLSLPEIGRRFSKRDHTTVLHAVRSYPARRAKMGVTVRVVIEPEAQR